MLLAVLRRSLSFVRETVAVARCRIFFCVYVEWELVIRLLVFVEPLEKKSHTYSQTRRLFFADAASLQTSFILLLPLLQAADYFLLQVSLSTRLLMLFLRFCVVVVAAAALVVVVAAIVDAAVAIEPVIIRQYVVYFLLLLPLLLMLMTPLSLLLLLVVAVLPLPLLLVAVLCALMLMLALSF